MKYAVEVKNREEQDFVCEKLGYTNIAFNWRYITSDFDRFDKYKSVMDLDYEIISFNEFKSRYEPQLKIGDTFEYNGFVCEVKKKIDLGKWYYIETRKKNYFTKMDKKRLGSYHYNSKVTEITNKEFIKQLEENSLS